ncbi:MAG TPA: ABC transporter substrate-binding protein, partial [Bacillota bacterium]|nr:ABC transporter substrate-binding protein [Bacillota bacterium]
MFFLAVLILIFTAGGCGTDKEEQAGLEQAGPVVLRLEGGDWGFPQPYTRYSRGPGNAKVNYIFDKLIEKDENGFIPWLAQDWEILDGGKKYVFQLVENAQWHDGEPFTAEDVVFTFEYIKKYPPVDAVDIFMDDSFLLEVKALSDYQVEFTFAGVDPNLFENLSSVYILPEHIWSKVDKPDEFTSEEAVIGTGPFVLTDYNKEHGTYRYEAFRDFWGPEPAVDVLEFVPVSDPVLALEKGDIHCAGIPVDVLSRFESNPRYTIVQRPGFWGYRLRFNM